MNFSFPNSISQNSKEIPIRTGSRLHFGLFSSPPPDERYFQGAGMMIDSPGICLKVQQGSSDQIQVKGANSEQIKNRIQNVLNQFRKNTGLTLHWKIDVQEFIPLHNGLGGGTQLALAVGYAICQCCDIKIENANQLAQWCGRGKRSSIGSYGFFEGGFLIDSGKESPDGEGECKYRCSVPESWRILLVTPHEQPGLAGDEEVAAFKKLPPLDQSTTKHLKSLLYDQMYPAIQNAELANFQNAVHTFGQVVGQQFSSVQYGVYATKFAQDLADQLKSKGIAGLGQTSWGPTLFAFFDSFEEEDILKNIAEISDIKKCSVRVVKAKNTGIEIFE